MRGSHARKREAEILGRAIGDASGDFPDTSRSAFPKGTPTFRRDDLQHVRDDTAFFRDKQWYATNSRPSRRPPRQHRLNGR
jgi:hypothetical protein